MHAKLSTLRVPPVFIFTAVFIGWSKRTLAAMWKTTVIDSLRRAASEFDKPQFFCVTSPWMHTRFFNTLIEFERSPSKT